MHQETNAHRDGRRRGASLPGFSRPAKSASYEVKSNLKPVGSSVLTRPHPSVMGSMEPSTRYWSNR